ncbi:transposable element Tcb1 transposase [Trichonephila clavipes]|nr:transposable element Tcb1 transposase [Trichonephila clavipes]
MLVCGDPVVNASTLSLFTATHHSHSWYDGMGCNCLQYTVTPSIDPWHHDSLAVYPWHPATTCVATHATALMSHFSTRQCSASHRKCDTRLSPYIYYPSLACRIPRSVSNQAYLGLFGTVSRASQEFKQFEDRVTANVIRNVSIIHTELVCLNAQSYRIWYSR